MDFHYLIYKSLPVLWWIAIWGLVDLFVYTFLFDKKQKSIKTKSRAVEVKSLQTSLCKYLGNDHWTGKAQVDGSDRRTVKFIDGTELNTTLLLRGEFDLLAVNCFVFGEKWRFVFANICPKKPSS